MMAGLQTYRDLDAWRVGMDLVEQTYRLCRRLPSDEKFELSAQMRKAAVSVPSNVAEGFGRSTARSFLYFINVAIGSVAELDTQIEAARRLQFVASEDARPLQDLVDRERQILHGMRRDRQRRIALGAGAVVLFIGSGCVTLLT